MMPKKRIGFPATLSVALFLLSGCAFPLRSGPEANSVSIVSRELVKTTRSWDGQLLPAYPQSQPEISIRRITIPAGARLETHSHPVINAGIVLSGGLTVVTTKGETLYLKAGDPIVEVVNKLHYGVNEGTIPAELVVFYAGTVSVPITVVRERSEGSVIPPAGGNPRLDAPETASGPSQGSKFD